MNGNFFIIKSNFLLLKIIYRFFPHQKRSLLKFNVLLTTYETVSSDFEELQWIHWRYIVVDEAHRLKSSNSKVLKLLKVLQTDYKLLLTGTLIFNFMMLLLYFDQ